MITLIDRTRQLFPEGCHDRVFLVGGSVRDMLLGRTGYDIDLISTLTEDEFRSCGFRLITGKSTAPIWFLHDDACGSVEATRILKASGLNTELSRRDFTINAMAMTLGGEIIDPLNGRIDLDRRLLRACSPQTFREDPLRIFRALRFEADGLEMTEETEELILGHDWTASLSAIPVERFSREMLKAMRMNRPERFFQRMLELRIGEEYLPEIFRMHKIPAGPLVHHPEGDLFTHSCQVLQRVTLVCSDPLARFCAMFHDIGKLATPPDRYPRHHGHDQAGFVMARDFCRRVRLPAHFGTSLSWISRLHSTFNLWQELRDSTKLRVADQAVKAGIVDVLPCVATADKEGGFEPTEWRKTVTIAAMSSVELGIDQAELEHIAEEKRADVILQAKILKLRESEAG